jgi:hypothetical protein
MAIMSETVKALKSGLGHAFARVRATFAFAAQKDLRALIAKVDALEAKLDELLDSGKKARAAKA